MSTDDVSGIALFHADDKRAEWISYENLVPEALTRYPPNFVAHSLSDQAQAARREAIWEAVRDLNGAPYTQMVETLRLLGLLTDDADGTT